MLMTLYLSFARGPEPSGTSTLWRGEGGCRLFFPSQASRSKDLGAVWRLPLPDRPRSNKHMCFDDSLETICTAGRSQAFQAVPIPDKLRFPAT